AGADATPRVLPGDPPRPRTLPAVFAAARERFGGHTAVVAGAERLTYAELDARSAALAARLATDGVHPGDFVVLLLERGADLVVAILAVLRAGGAYVPVDPGQPAARTATIVADVAPTVVVDAAYLATGPGDARCPGERSDGSCHVDAPITPAHPAYVIFTSGSTGTPKGVVVRHGNVTALLDATLLGPDHPYRIDATDVWTMCHAYTFDVSVFEMWGALSTGGTLVVPDTATTRSPQDLARLLADEHVSVLSQTPSAFFAFDAADASIDGGFDLPALRYVIFAGEALDLRRLPGFLDRHPRVAPVNMYGITETTVHSSFLAIDRRHAETAPGSDVGALLRGFRGKILDQYLREVPAGVVGELYLTGPQVTAGYLHRAGLTATRFVADPHGSGEIMYRSGDLMRQRADGPLLYSGRRDLQVKIRGFRIELGEIRSALAALDGVADAAVITRIGPGGTPRVLAYAVAAPGSDIDGAVLRARLDAVLPEYMVPAAVIVLDAIPLTVNGKTDTAALPEPEHHTAGRRPGSAMERAIAAIFADTLHLDVADIGVDDDFFALGGDSIVSTTMVNRARRAGIRLTPRQVFSHRTVAELAQVAEPITDGPAPAAPTTDAAERPIPLLPIMHRLRELGGTITRHNQSLVVDTPPDATPASIAAALQAVLDAHESLRMELSVVAGGVWGLRTRAPGAVRAADLLRVESLADHDGIADAVAATSDAAAGRLDPAGGVMVAATYLEPTAGERGRLVLVIHHLAVDGVSRRILLDDLATAYSGATITDSGPSLGRYAETVTARAMDPALLGEVAHWAEVLAPGGELIPGTPARPGVVGAQERLTVELDPAASQALVTAVPTALGVGVTAVFLGALRVAAGEVFGTADLVVDTERHGRDTAAAGLGALDLSHTVGWFTTLAPLRLPPAADLADAVRTAERCWAAVPSAGAGFGMLRHLNPQTSLALAGLARPWVLLNYLGRFSVGGGRAWAPAAESPALRALPDPDLGCAHPLEVEIVCRDTADGPVLATTFASLPDQLEPTAVAELSEAWTAALVRLAATSPADTLTAHHDSGVPS
ncbi:MAG: amino acid adenylation domain-containing protein, partial [Gordonia sp. (in: high G+C Gram-positive bacteria)]